MSLRDLCKATAFVLWCGATTALAAEEFGVQQGMIGVSGAAGASISHEAKDPDGATSNWSVQAALSYFVADPLSLDLIPAFSGNFDGDYLGQFHVAATGYLLPGQRFTPYLQGGLGFQHYDIRGFGSDTQGSYLVSGGVKFFLTQDIAFDTGLAYVAPFDYPDEGRMGYSIGLSLYFQP